MQLYWNRGSTGTQSTQAANSHTLTPEEGWLRSHPVSELLQVIRMKVLQPTSQKIRLHRPVAISKTLIWIRCLWVSWGCCQASAVWKEDGMLQNCLDSPKREILRPESSQFPDKTYIWKTYITTPSTLHTMVALSRCPTSQGSPSEPPTPLKPKALIQAKFSTAQWHLQHRQTSLKDLTIPVSLLANLQMHYRSFNDLRQNQSIAMLFQLKVLNFTFTAAPISPRGTQSWWTHQEDTEVPITPAHSCSNGDTELGKQCRSMFHWEETGFWQGEVL